MCSRTEPEHNKCTCEICWNGNSIANPDTSNHDDIKRPEATSQKTSGHKSEDRDRGKPGSLPPKAHRHQPPCSASLYKVLGS
jgi:hypothetical protein